MANIVIPAASVTPRRIVQYDYWDGQRTKRAPMPKDNKAKDIISTKATTRLRNAIELLVNASELKELYIWQENKRVNFRISFITLTLPSKQVHDDSTIYNKLLKPFVRWWRDRNPSLLYVWKAEKQDNGNVHYHLTTNSFIHHRTLRNRWNTICNTLGYCDRAGLNDPNSTDVHAVRDIQNLAKYLSNYFTKKDVYKANLKRYHRRFSKQLKGYDGEVFHLPHNYLASLKQRVTSRLWDASKLLLKGKCTVITEDISFQGDIGIMLARNTESLTTDFCRLWFPDSFTWSKLHHFRNAYDNFIQDIRRANRLSKPL